MRDAYSDEGTTGNRDFNNNIIIVDEVDSMFVDDSSKLAMLSEKMPLMSSLNFFFVAIWN